MTVPVELTSKAMSDLAQIADHVKLYNDATVARTVIKALLAEAKKLVRTTTIGSGKNWTGTTARRPARFTSGCAWADDTKSTSKSNPHMPIPPPQSSCSGYGTRGRIADQRA